MEKLETKKDLLAKFRGYRENPDDDVIRIKKEIEHSFMRCPELLYALHNKQLELELFDSNGNINWEWNEEKKEYEPLGEWDRYFSNSLRDGNIRPYLFVPDTQTEVTHYICYQIGTEENTRYNSAEKILDITFTIFVHENDRIDKLSGIPRHDLIASIIREKFAWLGLEIPVTKPIYNKESTTDNYYVTRTLKYECILPNDLVTTLNGITTFRNKMRY